MKSREEKIKEINYFSFENHPAQKYPINIQSFYPYCYLAVLYKINPENGVDKYFNNTLVLPRIDDISFHYIVDYLKLDLKVLNGQKKAFFKMFILYLLNIKLIKVYKK